MTNLLLILTLFCLLSSLLLLTLALLEESLWNEDIVLGWYAPNDTVSWAAVKQ